MGIVSLEDSGHRVELPIYSCVKEGLYSNSEWLKAVKRSLYSRKLNKSHPGQLKKMSDEYYGRITENVLKRKSHQVPHLSKACKHVLQAAPIQDSTWVHA